MAKIIKYKFLSCEVNHGTEESPDIEQILLDVEITCPTQASYDANYPIAEKEAIPGTIEVSGEFEPTDISPEERIAQLEDENKNLTAQVDALSFQLDFQEECLVEMATIVYA